MSPVTNIRLDVLHVPDCPNLAPLLDRLREVTDLPVTTREITTDAEATATRMAGSPTLLVNGVDPFGAPDESACGVACRLYRDEAGRPVPVPSADQLRHVITTARTTPSADVLSGWRARTTPLDDVHKAVHQAILRRFAATGRPPTVDELAAITADTGRAVTVVLRELHELDTIRLAPTGDIVVAYPFSATPTRHRVRIDDRTDVHAMCAIDAVGISAMLGQDTRIDSVDVTTGHPITVTTTAGHTRWEPIGAVVFVGADPGGGPSADCCCDYVNFFADHDGAHAWITAHPEVPGQILTQDQAESLATRIFGDLVTRRGGTATS